MSGLFGFDDFPPGIDELIRSAGFSDESSREEVVELVLRSDEFKTYTLRKPESNVIDGNRKRR